MEQVLKNNVFIPEKFLEIRGRKPLTEIIKFKIENGINIDVTKDIAQDEYSIEYDNTDIMECFI